MSAANRFGSWCRDDRDCHEVIMRLGHEVLGALAVAVAAMAPFAATAYGQSNEMGATRNAIGTLVIVRPDGIEDRLRGKGTLKLFEEDVLRTEPASQALVELADGITVALNENT